MTGKTSSGQFRLLGAQYQASISVGCIVISIKMTERNDKDRRAVEYDRAMLRSAFASLFWAVIIYRKQRGKYTLQMLSDQAWHEQI